MEVHSLLLQRGSASCLLWDTVHFLPSVLPKYHKATLLHIYILYDKFLRCSIKICIKQTHKHYITRPQNPYMPMPAFSLIL